MKTLIKYIIPVSLLICQIAVAEDNFGAIAYSLESGSYGYATNYSTRIEAEQVALEACAEKNKGMECTIKLWFKNAYGALAEGKSGFGTGWGIYKQDAQLQALDSCKQHTNNCDIKITIGTE